MSDASQVGTVGWIDITVDDADGLRDFYKEVVGWESDAVSMGDYSDYTMKTPSGGKFCVIEDPSGATAALYQP